MTCDSLQERAGRGLSDDTNHVAVRAHGEATEANKDRRHQNLSAPDILIFNTNFPPPKMYECARLQNVRVGEICVKTTSFARKTKLKLSRGKTLIPNSDFWLAAKPGLAKSPGFIQNSKTLERFNWVLWRQSAFFYK